MAVLIKIFNFFYLFLFEGSVKCTIQMVRNMCNLSNYVLKCQNLVVTLGLFLRPLLFCILHFILVNIDYTLSLHKESPHTVSPTSEPLLVKLRDIFYNVPMHIKWFVFTNCKNIMMLIF